MRRLPDMSKIEQAQHRNLMSIINRSGSTVEELKTARLKIDALEWKGQTGPIMELITKLTVRLDNVEEMGQSLSGEDRKAIIELRQLANRLDKSKLDVLETNVSTCLTQLAELSSTENYHHEDSQCGWSKHEGILVDARVKRQAIAKKLDDFTTLVDDKFRSVEKNVDALRRDLSTLIADAIDEAKIAIMTEAESAAILAVGNLLGESDGATTQKTDKP